MSTTQPTSTTPSVISSTTAELSANPPLTGTSPASADEPRTPPVTMKQIADKARVSTATVSRVLKTPERVSLTTRLRVEQVAEELGYLPQVIFRQSQRNTTRTILVVVPDICDPVFTDIIRGIEITAAHSDYLVIIADCAHQQRLEKSLIDLIIAKQIIGLLLLGGRLPLHASEEERRHLPPMVMVNESAPEWELASVHIDNLTAAFQAVNYLYELGHQRVACIAGPEELPLCHYRLQGYTQALARSGNTLDPNYIIHGDFSYKTGARALARLLALPKPPTAIFCHCDVIALGVLAYAKQQGLKVPHDLSVMGFDNITLAEFSDPPLTTIAQPRYDMGREAMLLLIDKINGKTVRSGSRLLESQLISRASTCVYTGVQDRSVHHWQRAGY